MEGQARYDQARVHGRPGAPGTGKTRSRLVPVYSSRSVNLRILWCSSIGLRVAGSEQTDSHLNVKLVLRPTIPHPDLSYLFDCQAESGLRSSSSRLAAIVGVPWIFSKWTAT